MATFHNQMGRPSDTFLGDMIADDTLGDISASWPLKMICLCSIGNILTCIRKYRFPKKIHGLILLEYVLWHEQVFSYQMLGKLHNFRRFHRDYRGALSKPKSLGRPFRLRARALSLLVVLLDGNKV